VEGGEPPEENEPALKGEASMDALEPRGWYSRGYLPHFDGGEVPQMVTFRLADSVPQARIEAWRDQLRLLPPDEAEALLRERIERYLDRGRGECHLRHPVVAALTEESLLHFDGERYRLFAWVVMPNHVHALFTPSADLRLSQVVQTWKSFTAHRANPLLGRRGTFWQREYFDRFIRDARHFDSALSYIENNPWKAGLCELREDWPYSSARRRPAGSWP
jgi:putative DNA methylase